MGTDEIGGEEEVVGLDNFVDTNGCLEVSSIISFNSNGKNKSHEIKHHKDMMKIVYQG